MSDQYDVVIVGAGHNGLTCAAYLSMAGIQVLVLESRHTVGGLASEYEFFPGFRAAMPNSPGSLEPKIVADLKLADYGLSFNRPDPSLVMPTIDGPPFIAWRDPDKTAEQIAQFSSKDMSEYGALFDFLNQFAEKLGVSLLKPPPTLRQIAKRLETYADEEAFAKIFLGSLADLLDEYLEADLLKSAIAAISMTSNLVGPNTPGTAYLMMMRPFSLASSSVSGDHDPRKQNLRGSTGLPVGGMGAITKAMCSCIVAHGGKVLTNSRVTEITCDEEGVKGVLLSSGEFIRTKVVSSNLHPRTTFIELLEDGVLSERFTTQINELPRRGSSFKLALALKELPIFSSAPKGLEREFAACQFRLAPNLDYMERAYDDAKLGFASKEPIVLGLIPSIMDPSVAPPGKHLMSLNIFHAPTKLTDGNWDSQREPYAAQCIELISQYIPNLPDIIIDQKALSPADLEREFGLLDGNIMHLDMMPRHMFGLRPVAEWSHYRTPVDGLYLCGSGAWPGGTVSGIPGHNASMQILKDQHWKL